MTSCRKSVLFAFKRRLTKSDFGMRAKVVLTETAGWVLSVVKTPLFSGQDVSGLFSRTDQAELASGRTWSRCM